MRLRWRRALVCILEPGREAERSAWAGGLGGSGRVMAPASPPQGDRKPLSPPSLEFPRFTRPDPEFTPTEQSSFWVTGGKSGYLCPLVALAAACTGG